MEIFFSGNVKRDSGLGERSVVMSWDIHSAVLVISCCCLFFILLGTVVSSFSCNRDKTPVRHIHTILHLLRSESSFLIQEKFFHSSSLDRPLVIHSLHSSQILKVFFYPVQSQRSHPTHPIISITTFSAVSRYLYLSISSYMCLLLPSAY